jgi:hypothetical protein
MKSKRCYSCKRKLFLFMFTKAKRFTIKSDLGKNRNCRVCTFKEAKNKVVRWDSEIKQFKMVNLTLKERIKEFFKK